MKKSPMKAQVMDCQAWAKAFGSPPEVIKNFKALQTSQTVKAIKAMVTEIFINLVISCWTWIMPAASQGTGFPSASLSVAQSAAKTGLEKVTSDK